MSSESAPSLRDLNLRPVYNRDNCPDMLGEFYVPVLKAAVEYSRMTYTFNGRSLSAAAVGVAGLINNGGRMRLICHHELEREVVEAIERGLISAENAVLMSIGDRPIVAIDPSDLAEKHHLDLLTWLVKERRLEIKVAIPRRGVFHRKTAIVADANGDMIALDGSLNESVHGWLHNDESFHVFRSWQQPEYLNADLEEFERLWENRASSSRVIPIPDALREQLIGYAPAEMPPEIESDDPPAEKAPRASRADTLWKEIREAIENDPQTTIETTPATLWPHQLAFWRRHARDADKPPRLLIADEVGLGKTIQAGILLKTLLNRKLARRVLILTPATARWQWQSELRHKFNIAAPVLDRRGASMRLVEADADATQKIASEKPWRDADAIIMSYDWLRRNMDAFSADDLRFDMAIFDEAHRARYLDVGNPSRRRPNSYLTMLQRLSDRAEGLALLTATPMQIDPAELWALLSVMNPEDMWSEDEFKRFYDTERPATLQEWDDMRRLWSRNGVPGTPEQIAELSRMSLSVVNDHLRFIRMVNPVTLERQMTPERIGQSMSMMRRSASIKRRVSRHTRNLLREYAREGRLDASVPERDVASVPIKMNAREREIYDTIPKLVREMYQGRQTLNRQALGFVMTHFRLRAGSSLYAFRQSLLALKERHAQGGDTPGAWDGLIEDVADEIEDDDALDFDPETALSDLIASDSGVQTLDDLIERCEDPTRRDSKFDEFMKRSAALRAEGHSKIMVFSRFWDTQRWLRERLSANSESLAGLSGQEDWIKLSDGSIQQVNRGNAIARIRDEDGDGLLLCTETAAESLNFQFCSAVINYDIPWNPMRLEQRIGRIDRIGQDKPVVRVVNLFYADTAEYEAYKAMEERIDTFTANVGVLQPILANGLQTIIMERAVADALEGTAASASVRDKVYDLRSPMSFDLDDLAIGAVDETDPPPAISMDDLSQALSSPSRLPDGYAASQSGANHWNVQTPDGAKGVVTTDDYAYEYAAGAVDFFGPGSAYFP